MQYILVQRSLPGQKETEMGNERKWRRWRLFIVTGVAVAGFLFSSSSASQLDQQKEPQPVVSRIAFGSCANQDTPQPIWNSIVNFDPQVFIWLGDNIYGDIRRPFKLLGRERTVGPWKNVPRFVPSSKQEMMLKYKRGKTIPGYSRLRQRTKVIGTWDDHDYGLNDAGKEFTEKATNQKLLLDFLDEPLDSPRRKQHGVYASYMFGPIGKQIKVILLDTRYHRDPMFSDGTILGAAQWTWLERELKGPESAVTIIGSSIQVISNLSATTRPLFYLESWGRFPKERELLFKLIADSKRNGVLFISGDVHFGEISRFDCGVEYPLYDITSSGLTQAVERVLPRPLQFAVRFLAWVTPSTMRVKESNCRYKSCTFGQPNFGVVEIDWDATPVRLKMEVRDANGVAVVGVNISLSSLRPGNSEYLSNSNTGKYHRHCLLEVSLGWIVRHRLAILFYCTLTLLLLGSLGTACVATLACRSCIRKCKRD